MMCKYCSEESSLCKWDDYGENAELEISMNSDSNSPTIDFSYGTNDIYSCHEEIKIKYCPFCGRKLI